MDEMCIPHRIDIDSLVLQRPLKTSQLFSYSKSISLKVSNFQQFLSSLGCYAPHEEKNET